MSAITNEFTAGLGAPAPTASVGDAYSSIDSAEFMEIIFTQLGAQDPLQPNDTQALLEQLALIRNIESDLALQENLETLVRQNEVTSASSLIGKIVTGIDTTGTRTAGFVDSVSVTRDGVILNLNGGSRVAFDQVDEVIDPTLLGDDASVDDEPTDGVDGDGGDDGGTDDDPDNPDAPEPPTQPPSADGPGSSNNPLDDIDDNNGGTSG
ncbi:MAG: flagellar hook capping FlgD N-terminal domain-containing protein [Planctomycetota bacterium]